MNERIRAGLLAALATAATTLAVAPAALAGSWTQSLLLTTTSTADLDHLSLFEDGTGFNGHAGRGVHTLHRTTDGGRTWTEARTPAFEGTGVIRFGSPTAGFALSNAKLYRSTDAGESWQDQPGPQTPAGRLLTTSAVLAVAAEGRTLAFPGREIAADGTCDPAVPWQIHTSHDGGASWRAAPLGATGRVADLRYLDAKHGVVLAYDHDPGDRCAGGSSTFRVSVTDDGGATFREVFQCPAGAPCTTVAMASPKRIFVGHNDGRVSRTHDGGATWTTTQLDGKMAALPESYTSVRSIDFADCNVGYAYANGRGMYRTVDGGRTWARESSLRETHTTGWGEVAAAGEHALAGGPYVLERRVPAAGDPVGAPCGGRGAHAR